MLITYNMERRKKIFLCNDASFLSTGYGIYGKEILSRLYKSDKFEIAELGCYAHANDPYINTVPWKFYPNAVGSNDHRYNDYKKNSSNQFGLWRFNKCLLDFKPDIVFDVRDYWMFSYQELSPLKPFFKWIIMPATDSSPPKLEWLYSFKYADCVVPYTDWAKKVLLEYAGKKINLYKDTVNAGINPFELLPLHSQKIKKIKANYFGNEDSIVIGSVMRNQKRKLLNDYFLMFRKYLNKLKQNDLKKEYDRSILYLHTTYPEDLGWDIPSLLLEYNISDKVYFSYICNICNEVFPNKFQGPITYCKNCNNHSAKFTSPSESANNSQLCYIYNSFDIYIQYAICEGFGMPQIEAASCGVPVASVDYSAMSEVVKNLEGFILPTNRIFREQESNADRAYPDIEKTADIIYDYLINYSEEEKQTKKNKSRQLCINKYSWDSVYKKWEECFDSIDITENLPWNYPLRETGHIDTYVTKNLKKYEFIYYICKNIIKDPKIIETGYIQGLLRDFNHILVSKGTMSETKGHKEIIEVLEIYMKNKIFCEKIRCGIIDLPKEDYLTCQK
jgi:glycosyltransferase involved in cell wall biosynthesis